MGDTSCCLVVLIGLPGCGKSYFCQNFVESYPKSTLDKSNYVLHISYDTLMFSENRQLKTIDWKSEWNSKRKEIVDCIDWHLGQTLNEGVNHLDNNPSGKIFEIFNKYTTTDMSPHINNLGEIVYLIDDNMFYESMRKRFYQLAQKHNVGFAQIYFDYTIQECLIQNERRQNTIPEEIIYEMNEKLEKPCTDQPWQKYTIFFNSSMSNFEKISRALDLKTKASKGCVIDHESHKIKREEKIKSQLISSSNLRQQSDQILRKIISKELSEKSVLMKNDIKIYAAKLNEYKKLTLEKLRGFHLEKEPLFCDVTNSSSDHNSYLYRFVKQTFEDVRKEN